MRWLARRLSWRVLAVLVCSTMMFSVMISNKLMNSSRDDIMSRCGPAGEKRLVRSRAFSEGDLRSEMFVRQGARHDHAIPEVDDFVQLFSHAHRVVYSPYTLEDAESYTEYLYRLHSHREKGRHLVNITNPRSSMEKFYQGITSKFMYDLDNYTLIEQLLKDVSTLNITKTEQQGGGTSPKLRLTFSNGMEGVFKPMRVGRKEETNPDAYYFHDTERHNAEIAAFHLDKVLGFNRAIPTVGRSLHINEDIKKTAGKDFNVTFYTSSDGNRCFYFDCLQMCGARHVICGQQERLEGAIGVLLPPLSWHLWIYPWKRSYNYRKKTTWEDHDDYCDTKVKTDTAYNRTDVMLDLMDMSILDFLIGNLDRHDYQYFRNRGKSSFIIHFDQGRGFGKSQYDCRSCLAPLRQCCVIRMSTLAKLVKLYLGPDSLSHVMRESMTSDPISPVLWEAHLDALDRRLGKVIQTVRDCIGGGRSWDSVMIDDLKASGYYGGKA